MFIKLTRRGPNQYVQLVAAYRDDAGRPKQRSAKRDVRIAELKKRKRSSNHSRSMGRFTH